MTWSSQKSTLVIKFLPWCFDFWGALHKYPTCTTCISYLLLSSFSRTSEPLFGSNLMKKMVNHFQVWKLLKWVAWFVVNLPFGAHLGWRSFNLGRFSSSVKKMSIMYTCVYAIFCIYTSDCWAFFRGVSLPNHEGLPLLKSRILVILWSTFQGAEK